MDEQGDPDVDEIDDQSCAYKHGPHFFDLEAPVLAEFVVERRSDVLEWDYLLFGEPSYRDLEDRDAAVAKERESYYQISKRNLQIDRVECDEEAQ